MSRRAMFWRMVISSILRRRSRVLIAVLAVAIGATTLSGLVTIAVDVPAQMAREIRSYGANLVVSPAGDGVLTDEAVAAATSMVPSGALVGSAAFDYETVTINDQPYVAGGTDLAAVRSMNPYWYVDGQWPGESGQVLVGEQIASTIDVKTGSTITISQLDGSASAKAAQAQAQVGATPQVSTSHDAATQSGASTSPATQGPQSGAGTQGSAQASALEPDPRSVTLTVSGILKTGGNEDGYVYMSTQDMDALTGTSGTVSLAEYSIALEGNALSAVADGMNAANPDIHAQTVRRLAQSDTGVLTMLRSLLVVITVIVLALTMIGVSTTMIAVVTERRNEIGLRKALGATARSITTEFMGEGIMLGLIGGILGAGAGYGLAVLISTSVFHRSISLHPLILIGTIACSILIAVLACLPPVRRALAVDPALVLRGE